VPARPGRGSRRRALLRMIVRESATQASGGSVLLRPGVAWPMWSCVTDPTARRALEASLDRSRWIEKWAGLDASEDRLWRAILSGFARTGQAQDLPSLGAATGLDTPAIASHLGGLQGRDILVLDAASGSVTAAYPFCAWASEQRVAIAGGATVHALCAIDALGAGAMLGRDSTVESRCRLCKTPVRIETREHGRALRQVTPSGVAVWAGQHYADNCSATSGCIFKAFFCSPGHLAAWRERDDRDGEGFALTPAAALQIGLALFPPLLMPEIDA
jgi:mercuric reductase